MQLLKDILGENSLKSGDDVAEDYQIFDDLVHAFNITDAELNCSVGFVQDPYPPPELALLNATLFCNSTYDGILCWPTTIAGSTAVLPCFPELNGIKYDTSQNATRVCLSSGNWDNYSNYKSCAPLVIEPADNMVGISEETTTIYFTGHSISILALTVALWIFTRFKDLRCLRNTIHTHLLITYVMADLLWIVTATLQVLIGQTNTGSCIIVIFLHYFHLTNFSWMFVEGFYLYMLVVKTFSADKIKLRMYVFIGWGIPLPIVIIWAIIKAHCHAPNMEDHKLDFESFLSSCPWIAANSYDWIYMAPAIIVLFLNVLFLIRIMWVLITKLRSANSAETQQYRKGSKALLVLIPLLGLTYVLVIAGPTEGTLSKIFSFMRAILLSTQGFSVTLFYCFLNTEVRNAIRHHWERWRTNQALQRRSASRRGTRIARDGSLRGPTESMRLYHSYQGQEHKRDMSVSEVTTMTSFPARDAHLHLNYANTTNGNGYASHLSSHSSGISGRCSAPESSNLLTRENQV